MTKDDAQNLVDYLSEYPANQGFVAAFKGQIETYVKRHMRKVKPRILHVGGGVMHLSEQMVLATEYTHAEITAVEPDPTAVRESLALTDYLLYFPVTHAPLDTLQGDPSRRGKGVEEIERGKGFDLVVWRNPRMYDLPDRTIHQCLSLTADEGVVYFTASEDRNYELLLQAVNSYSENGVQIEIVHPTPLEFQQPRLPESPRELQSSGLGFRDPYILAIKVHRERTGRRHVR